MTIIEKKEICTEADTLKIIRHYAAALLRKVDKISFCLVLFKPQTGVFCGKKSILVDDESICYI